MVQQHQEHSRCSYVDVSEECFVNDTVVISPIAHRRSRLILSLDQLIGRQYPIVVVPIGELGRHGKVCSILLSSSDIEAKNGSRKKRLIRDAVYHFVDTI